jgi:two-component system response regulator HydG
METILVVDGDAGFRKVAESVLTAGGCRVETAAVAREAVAFACRRNFDLVLADLGLPENGGQAVLRWFADRAPETPVIALVPFGNASAAMEALKLGAADYIGKPLNSQEDLRILVRRTLENRRSARERELLREEVSGHFNCNSIIARDPGMLEVAGAARRAAGSPATVLVTGESGTGKELLARFIHFNGPRAGRAFVTARGAAADPGMPFGYEKVGLGGVTAQQISRFEQAHLGTLFLEGVSRLDSQLQNKLLRFLEEGTFERMGGTREMRVDVRLIVSTTHDLRPLVAEGKFRADLYRRLAEVSLTVPPLRERPGDIPVLARFFLTATAGALEKPNLFLTPAAEHALLRYDWPGNVRELRNLMERLAILCDGPVEERHIPAGLESPRQKLLQWKDIERQAIEDTLRMTAGNRTRAARQLGISLRTLQYRLKEWGGEPYGAGRGPARGAWRCPTTTPAGLSEESWVTIRVRHHTGRGKRKGLASGLPQSPAPGVCRP